MKTYIAGAAIAVALIASPAYAQLGGLTKAKGALDKAKSAKDKVDAFFFTDAEETQLGSDVSEKLRTKYGVVQDKAVHRYVTLAGTVVAQNSSKPNMKWTFIVLDTDGVNAFAAPGGFVHITRGALALIDNEAELANVLGHEITHITERHTINAIKKAQGAELLAEQARAAFLSKLADKVYESVIENNFDRGDEDEADKVGVTIAAKAGYAPTGLGAFLTRLADRNKGLQERSGLFASHPQTKDRIAQIAKVIKSANLSTTALAATRYHQMISYKPVPVTAIAAAAEGSAGLTSGKAPAKDAKGSTETKTEAKQPETKSAGKFGLGGLNPLSKEKGSSQTVASAGTRGVNPDRDAKGGSNRQLVTVTISATDVADFKKGIA